MCLLYTCLFTVYIDFYINCVDPRWWCRQSGDILNMEENEPPVFVHADHRYELYRL